MNATTQNYSPNQFEQCISRGRQLRSIAIIDITRQMFGLPKKAAIALGARMDRQAEKLNTQCGQCA